MRGFFRFCSRFAGAILMIIGGIAAILWALETGVAITKADAWLHPDRSIENIIGFSIAVSGFGFMIVFGILSLVFRGLKVFVKIGKFIIWLIAIALVTGLVVQSGFYLQRNTDWLHFNSVADKANIGVFSVGIGLMGMNIIFGLFSLIGAKKQD